MMRLCSLCLGWCDWDGQVWVCSDCGEVWYTPDMTARYPSVTDCAQCATYQHDASYHDDDDYPSVASDVTTGEVPGT